MTNRAFAIVDGRAARIANDDTDFRYRGIAHELAVGAEAPVRVCPRAELQFLVESGTVEFMINGASGIVLAGDFVRVPAGVTYAYRNAGDGLAQILVRQVNPATAQIAARVTGHFAA